MTQEQRVKELEKQVSDMQQQIANMQEAIIHYQDSNQANFNDINAAIFQTAIDSNVLAIIENAEANTYECQMQIGINNYQDLNVKLDKIISLMPSPQI
ncbi:hypothetical protein [Yersinia intermedia]|uniref:hypothetical protein n=1 Tax=Yersinia intermedia TaxID=631 RepID=UPI0022FDCE2D|nr:hypothetical protein [Yersinia intermedia]MDA5514508.1 hypothetical protein [Yersinia intermedia]